MADGTIDVIVSGHDPQSADTKRLPFAEAAFGAIGLETMLSAALGPYHNENMPFSRLVEAMSSKPAEILGSGNGPACSGRPGRFRARGSNQNWTVEDDSLRSRAKNSPLRIAHWKAGCRNGRCRRQRLRIPSQGLTRGGNGPVRTWNDRLDPVRLSLRYHSLWLAADEVGRIGRCPADRLGQHRRHQRAAHREQDRGRPDPASRRD